MRLRFLHVLAAIGWVGGQLLLSLVVLPVLRRSLDPATREELVRSTARRFGFLLLGGFLPLAVVTGVALAFHRGVTLGSFGQPGYGRLLAAKIVLVVVMVAIGGVHGVLAARSPGAARVLGVAGLATSLAVVFLATALVP